MPDDRHIEAASYIAVGLTQLALAVTEASHDNPSKTLMVAEESLKRGIALALALLKDGRD